MEESFKFTKIIQCCPTLPIMQPAATKHHSNFKLEVCNRSHLMTSSLWATEAPWSPVSTRPQKPRWPLCETMSDLLFFCLIKAVTLTALSTTSVCGQVSTVTKPMKLSVPESFVPGDRHYFNFSDRVRLHLRSPSSWNPPGCCDWSTA